MLEGQCNVWNGVISAAVYVALVNGKAVTIELTGDSDPQLTPMDVVLRKFEEFLEIIEAKSESVWTWVVGMGGGGRRVCGWEGGGRGKQ
jgi:hypothetical protein